jgi:hypothetical protein
VTTDQTSGGIRYQTRGTEIIRGGVARAVWVYCGWFNRGAQGLLATIEPSTYSYTAVEFRSRGDKDTGANSGHFTVHEPVDLDYPDGNRTPKFTVPTIGDVHFGEHNGLVNLKGAKKHSGELTRP